MRGSCSSSCCLEKEDDHFPSARFYVFLVSVHTYVLRKRKESSNNNSTKNDENVDESIPPACTETQILEDDETALYTGDGGV